MADLTVFEQQLRAQLDADRLSVVAPPVGAVLARARRRSRGRAAGAALATAALVGGAALVVDARPGTTAEAPLASSSDEVVLAEGEEAAGPWRLVGRGEERCVTLVRATSEGGACGLGDPPRLDETSVLTVGEGAQAKTLVAGLLPAGAELVVVEPSSGDSAVPAAVRRGAGVAWFVVQLDGVTGVDGITALGPAQETVAELAMPLLPPPPPVNGPDAGPAAPPLDAPPPPPGAADDGVVRAPAPTRLEGTDEFGRVVAVVEVVDGVEVVVDRVEMLSGEQARQAAAERGDTLDTDHYLVDDVDRTRTYRLSSRVAVWGSIGMTGQVDAEPRTLQQLREFLQTPRGRDTLFHLDVEDGVVVGVEEQYLP